MHGYILFSYQILTCVFLFQFGQVSEFLFCYFSVADRQSGKTLQCYQNFMKLHPNFYLRGSCLDTRKVKADIPRMVLDKYNIYC